jgi:exonuclease III
MLSCTPHNCKNRFSTPAQVIIAGDLNIAASQKDVHSKLDYSKMYSPEEKALLGALLRDYHDVWRELHPDVCDMFTVWDEKTSARAFNEVRRPDGRQKWKMWGRIGTFGGCWKRQEA